MSEESKLTTADRRVIDRAIAETLRTLAHMARGNADQNASARDFDHLADIIEGKVPHDEKCMCGDCWIERGTQP